MNRRTFLTVAVAAPMAGALPLDLSKIPARKVGKVEIVFKSPGDDPKPNGLQATSDGLWIIDQGTGNKAYLVSYKGHVLRAFETETDRSSGINFDGESLWVGSTYNRQIVRVDVHTCNAIKRHFTPGAGVIYQMVGDPKARRSPLTSPNLPRPQSGAAEQVGGFQAGRFREQWRPEPVRTDRSGGMENFGSPSRLRGPSIAWIRRRGWFKPSSPLRETARTASDGKANISGSRIRI